jgi:hypothetical protein
MTHVTFSDAEINELILYLKNEFTELNSRADLIHSILKKFDPVEADVNIPPVQTMKPKFVKVSVPKKRKAKGIKKIKAKPIEQIEEIKPLQIKQIKKVKAEPEPEVETKAVIPDPVKITSVTDVLIEEKKLPTPIETTNNKSNLENFLFQTLKKEDRFFSFESLVSLSCTNYNITNEFEKENMLRKVKGDLRKLAKRGMVIIKRPKEGKRFLYKIS